MFENILIIIGLILAIAIIIGVHELGHYWVARFFGVQVRRVSIGFGKPLWCWHDKQGTEYVIALFPLGGYVTLLDGRETHVPPEQIAQAFNHKSLLIRSAIVLAGPLFNILLAILLYWLVFIIGLTQPVPLIGAVMPQSIAANAGLTPGTEIIALDNEATDSWRSVIFLLLEDYKDKSQLTLVTRDQKSKIKRSYVLDLRTWQINALKPDVLKSLGLIPKRPFVSYTQRYSVFSAVWPAIQGTKEFVMLNVNLISKLVTGKISLQILGGPLSLFEGIITAVAFGFQAYLLFIIFISISVAVLNLLPIPGLDGGYLLLYMVEAIRGKPLSYPVELLLIRLGLIGLFILVAQTIANDLLRMK